MVGRRILSYSPSLIVGSQFPNSRSWSTQIVSLELPNTEIVKMSLPYINVNPLNATKKMYKKNYFVEAFQAAFSEVLLYPLKEKNMLFRLVLNISKRLILTKTYI